MLATFLADVLRAAGLNVVEEGNWKARGRGPLLNIAGVICHHTAGPPAPKGGATPSLNLVLSGRPDLAGPLSQLYLARDGTFHVLAAGRCNHAGKGLWRQISGNSTSLGIEAENAGDGHDPWPEIQVDAYARGVAAILRHLGLTADDCCGHKEFALPHGRKIDPSFEMGAFRQKVAADMLSLNNQTVTPSAIPTPRLTLPAHAMLKRGDRNGSVAEMQSKLGIAADGVFGPGTEAALKAFQSRKGLTPDGLCGPATWSALG